MNLKASSLTKLFIELCLPCKNLFIELHLPFRSRGWEHTVFGPIGPS